MKFFKKNYLLIIFIIVQTILYIIVGCNKEYLHLDESYSFGLSNYERIEIQDNADFFDTWHTKDYYNDYLAVQEKDVCNYKPVYENQKNDVHPPLFYLLLRFSMGFTKGSFSKWCGIGLNIIIYAFITVLMFLILKKLFKNEKYDYIKASVLAFVSSITLASLSNAVYIRMYALSTLNILITTFLHIKLLENNKLNFKLLVCIGFSVLAGVLTHYYYLFYLFALYLVFFIKFVKEKRLKDLVLYSLTMLFSGIIFLFIFPYSLQHMFFGYRGQGVISNLTSISKTFNNLFSNIYTLNYYGFNNLLFVIIPIIVIVFVYIKIRKKMLVVVDTNKKNILNVIFIPALFFFVITAISSPWNVLRYIVPVCGLLFVLTFYCLYELLKIISNEKISTVLVSIFIFILLFCPFVCNMEPELLYRDRKEIVHKLSNELNLPTIYLYNTNNGNFLDDILLFSKIDESYVTKNINYTKENIQSILSFKDISNGLIVFTNENEDIDSILQVVKDATGLNNAVSLKKLNSCEVFYVIGNSI